MTYDEMNNFILNYLTTDLTGRAIMLSGGWGSGKSYYVKNKLKSFLEGKHNDKYKCVIVSLYGLSDTSEISKAIYTELRSFKFKKKHEVLTTAGTVASIVPRTVFNAMTSRVGYDIGQVSDKQMQKGSRKCTCISNSEGISTRPVPSITLSASAEIFLSIFEILPPLMSRSVVISVSVSTARIFLISI